MGMVMLFLMALGSGLVGVLAASRFGALAGVIIGALVFLIFLDRKSTRLNSSHTT
jgi:membrane associated rhomboid family serine protease